MLSQDPIRSVLMLAALAAPAIAPAWESSSELGVDRNGTALVNFGISEGFEQLVALVDRDGRLLRCGPQSSLFAARARLDAPGFLVRRFDEGLTTESDVLERWDGTGSAEWWYPFRGQDYVPAPDGGAAFWEQEFVDSQMRSALTRLDAAGDVRWRTNLYPGELPPMSVDLLVDARDRVLFAADPHGLLIGDPAGTARLGAVSPDGQLEWQHQEPRARFTETRIVDDGSGDFWWFAARNLPQGRPDLDRPSRLERWTPWGLHLFGVDGPALIAGSDITHPVPDGSSSVWYLAEGGEVSELVRLDALDRPVRHALTTRSQMRRYEAGGFRMYPTLLSVTDGTAWVAGTRPGSAGELMVERYTRDARAWTRRLVGLERLRGLENTASGDALLLATAADGEGWLLKLTPRRGDVAWRVSISELRQACGGAE